VTARLGVQAGPAGMVSTGVWPGLRLSTLRNCAEAIVVAAEAPAAHGRS